MPCKRTGNDVQTHVKKLYDLSDECLISSAQTDMAYKYFLELEPESPMVDSSLLTKFRKTHITEDILEKMLKETIQQALDKGLIKSWTIIVDSIHTNASVRAKSPTQILWDLSKQLRKKIYKNMYDLSERFPEKPPTSTFYGYKYHLTMTEERLIERISVMPGGEPDGRQMPGLIEMVQKNGIEVTEVLGDMVHVSEDNIDACGKKSR